MTSNDIMHLAHAEYLAMPLTSGPRLVVFTGNATGSSLDSWCPDCQRAMPAILAAAIDGGLPLTVVGVGMRDDWKLDARGISNPLRAKDGLALTGVPTLLLMDSSGKEMTRLGSELEEEQDVHRMKQLIADALSLVGFGPLLAGDSDALQNALLTASSCVRIFVAGAVTHVGKTTVCLSILAALRRAGLQASDLAYIKPATQCEAPDLLSKWCAAEGVEHVAGEQAPLVFYSGFTRSFLEGEQGTSAQWLQKIAASIDSLAEGRRVVIIDGVGFPAVGSVVGVDNADVAKVSRAPVLLVCKAGVGGAIDSFSLNSTYFTAKGVPVLGAVFNLADCEGFYSSDKCLESLNKWFSAPGTRRESCYGVIPKCKELDGLRERISQTEEEQFAELANLNATHFSKHVDIAALLRDAACDPWNRAIGSRKRGCASAAAPAATASDATFEPPKRASVQAGAKMAGAKGGG